MLCVFMPLRPHVDFHSVHEFLDERDVYSSSTECELLFPWLVNDFVGCALRSVFLNAHDEVWRFRRLNSAIIPFESIRGIFSSEYSR